MQKSTCGHTFYHPLPGDRVGIGVQLGLQDDKSIEMLPDPIFEALDPIFEALDPIFEALDAIWPIWKKTLWIESITSLFYAMVSIL